MNLRVVPSLLDEMQDMLGKALAEERLPRQWHVATASFAPLLKSARDAGAFERRAGGDLFLGLPVKLATDPDAPPAALLYAPDDETT